MKFFCIETSPWWLYKSENEPTLLNNTLDTSTQCRFDTHIWVANVLRNPQRYSFTSSITDESSNSMLMLAPVQARKSSQLLQYYYRWVRFVGSSLRQHHGILGCRISNFSFGEANRVNTAKDANNFRGPELSIRTGKSWPAFQPLGPLDTPLDVTRPIRQPNPR